MAKKQLAPNLVFNFMDNMDMANFCVIGIDAEGDAYMSFRTTSPAGDRALRGFVEDWLLEQERLVNSGSHDLPG